MIYGTVRPVTFRHGSCAIQPLECPSLDGGGSFMHGNETLGSARVKMDEATNVEPLAARQGS